MKFKFLFVYCVLIVFSCFSYKLNAEEFTNFNNSDFLNLNIDLGLVSASSNMNFKQSDLKKEKGILLKAETNALFSYRYLNQVYFGLEYYFTNNSNIENRILFANLSYHLPILKNRLIVVLGMGIGNSQTEIINNINSNRFSISNKTASQLFLELNYSFKKFIIFYEYKNLLVNYNNTSNIIFSKSYNANAFSLGIKYKLNFIKK